MNSAPKPGIGRVRQAEIYTDGLSGRRPIVPINPDDLEKSAQAKLPVDAFAYIAGGAGLERTMAANRQAFDHWQIVPRVLNDVSRRDSSIELLGHTIPAPILTAPIGVLEMAHREADHALARAAAAESVPMIISNQASFPMETIAEHLGHTPRLFQLYWGMSDELMLSLVDRAEACQCSAIVITVDTTLLGWRTRDLDLGYLPFLRGKGIAQYTHDPVFQKQIDNPLSASSGRRRITLTTLAVLWQLLRAYPDRSVANLRSGKPLRAANHFTATYSRPSLTWDNLALLTAHTRLPVFLKGILHPDDARKALDYGIQGLIVSNHGGRQVDGAIGALDALPAIIRAVEGQVPVLFDSGVRTGADVFKALALGARAVCIGRPYVYGLALAGEAGVRAVLRNMKADFDLTMGLAGCKSISEISADRLVRAGG